MIFNRLIHAEGFATFEGKHVLDVFAGTGALGLEALSRGAAHVTFFEKSHQTADKLRTFLRQHKLDTKTILLRLEAPYLPDPVTPVNLCFLDAPYGHDLISKTLPVLLDKKWLAPQAVLVTEIDERETITVPEILIETDRRQKGRTIVSFFRFMG